MTTKTADDENYEINHTKDGAYLFFEAAGFNKSNLKVEMESGIIHIEGKRVYKLNGEEKTKSISKQFKIGDTYNPTSIEATIEDGLLTVFVPNYKKQEKKRINLL
jgi:HSP20 family molecular chaperone IbpA